MQKLLKIWKTEKLRQERYEQIMFESTELCHVRR